MTKPIKSALDIFHDGGDQIHSTGPNDDIYVSYFWSITDRDAIVDALTRAQTGTIVPDDVEALKHPSHMLVRGILSEDPSKNYNCGLAQGWNNAIDHLASRNLLKTSGVCVPDDVMAQIVGALEFYSNDESYSRRISVTPSNLALPKAPVIIDKGETAQSALAAIQKIKGEK